MGHLYFNVIMLKRAW